MANDFEKAAKLGAEKRLGEAQARKVMSEIYETVNNEALVSATAREFLVSWPEKQKEAISLRTYAAYSQVARDFVASLGARADRDINQIRKSDVTKYRDEVAARTSPATANKLLKYLRVGLGKAWKDGLLTENVAAKVDRIPKRMGADDVERRPFTEAELNRVMTEARKDPGGEWEGLVLFGLYTAQRLGDIGCFRWSHINIEDEALRFVSGKTGRRMEIPLARPLLEFIQKMPAQDDPDAPLFPKAHEIAVLETGDSRLSQQFYDLLFAAGLVKQARSKSNESRGVGRNTSRVVNPLSFHSLRHTTTSILKRAGVPEATVRDIVGHESKAVSQIYTHIDLATKRKALRKLPELAP